MGPLSYLIAFVCIAFAVYYWYTNNQLKSQIKDAARSDDSTLTTSKPSKPSQKFLDFDSDCKIRALNPSDLDTIKAMVKGEGGCNYFIDHSLEPFLNESNRDFLGFGVEHKATQKIICTQFVIMVDCNETGLVLGGMIDMKYKSDSRIIYMRLSNDVQSQLTSMFDKLGKYRCIEINDKPSYLNNKYLDWKIKFNLDDMNKENIYYLLERGDDDNNDGIKVNGDFKECEDIDNVINLLQNKFKVNDVLMDWGLFQVKYLKNEIFKNIKNNKISMMIKDDGNGLCLIYGNNDYYIYGVTANDILSGVRFAISRNKEENLGGIFINKSMVNNNDQLKKIFNKAMENEIVLLEYDMHIDGH